MSKRIDEAKADLDRIKRHAATLKAKRHLSPGDKVRRYALDYAHQKLDDELRRRDRKRR